MGSSIAGGSSFLDSAPEDTSLPDQFSPLPLIESPSFMADSCESLMPCHCHSLQTVPPCPTGHPKEPVLLLCSAWHSSFLLYCELVVIFPNCSLLYLTIQIINLISVVSQAEPKECALMIRSFPAPACCLPPSKTLDLLQT